MIVTSFTLYIIMEILDRYSCFADVSAQFITSHLSLCLCVVVIYGNNYITKCLISIEKVISRSKDLLNRSHESSKLLIFRKPGLHNLSCTI